MKIFHLCALTQERENVNRYKCLKSYSLTMFVAMSLTLKYIIMSEIENILPDIDSFQVSIKLEISSYIISVIITWGFNDKD